MATHWCLVTSPDNIIRPANLPPELAHPTEPRLPFHIDPNLPLPEVLHQAVAAIEQQYLRKALKKARGHVGRCAKISGLSRRSITAKLAEYNLDRKVFKDI